MSVLLSIPLRPLNQHGLQAAVFGVRQQPELAVDHRQPQRVLVSLSHTASKKKPALGGLTCFESVFYSEIIVASCRYLCKGWRMSVLVEQVEWDKAALEGQI